MTAVDLGQPFVGKGRCPRCDLDDRPLWSTDGELACASCWTRLLPGVAITFHGGVRPETVAQPLMPGLVA